VQPELENPIVRFERRRHRPLVVKIQTHHGVIVHPTPTFDRHGARQADSERLKSVRKI